MAADWNTPRSPGMKIDEMIDFLRGVKDSGCAEVEFQDDNWNIYSGSLHELSGRAIIVVSPEAEDDPGE